MSSAYNVQLQSPLRTFQVSGVLPNSSGLSIDVPATFYATTSHPGQSDPVLVTVTSASPGGGSGSFLINPPLTAGAAVFASPVGNGISATLFTGGTPPYEASLQSGSGSGPPGMDAFPNSSNIWTGTPSQTGTYPVIIFASDAWGNQTSFPTQAFYIVPKSQLTSISPQTTLAGAGNTTLTINGSGFISPATVNAVAEPGSLVSWTPSGGSAVTLTPSSITSGQLTVTLPSTLLPTTGIFGVAVVNPSPYNSNAAAFAVTPSITGLSPTTRTAGASPFTLSVSGTGYVNGSVVQVDFKPIPTTYISPTALTATFPTIGAPELASITVRNPDTTISPLSSGAAVSIVAPPTLDSLNPTSTTQGGPAFLLTVTGKNLLSSDYIVFNNLSYSTSIVNSGQIAALIPASAITTAGTVYVTVNRADGYVTSAASFTIVSNIPPLAFSTLSPLPSGVVNVPYSATIAVTGGTGTYKFAINGGSLPAGLTMSSTGVISGTPSTAGQSHFSLLVTDSASSTIARDYVLAISAAPLTLTTPPLSNVLQNAPLSVQFAGTGGITPYTFVEFGALPPGVQFSSAGLLSGTPTQPGTYSFTVFLDDSAGAYTSGKYSILVALPGLLITPPSPLPSGQVGVSYSAQLAATGGQGAPYNWSATGLPPGLTIANNSGLITGTPREAGTYTVAVTLGDLSGQTVTQSYTLTIASSKLTITTQSLPNGAVGIAYSGAVAATGGSGAITFSATGLPAGVTIAGNGILTGTPTAAGTFTVNVTATDAQSQTASAPFTVAIAPKLTVNGVTIANAILGTAIASTKVTATGGTSPYQFQAANLPPGLSLATDGTLSGTPTTQGTFSFPVFAVDTAGTLASGTVQVTVGLPTAPAASILGLPTSNTPATQPRLQVALANPYPVNVTAKLTLTFAPDSGADDPAVQFATGGRNAQIVIPAGSTGGLTDLGLQTGTVAGTITITAQLLAGAQDVTPSPAPTRSTRVTPGPPVITAVTATRTGAGFTVLITGFSTTRDVASASFQFAGSTLANLQTTQLTVPVGTLFTPYYASSAAAPFGSQFTLSQPFTVTGDTSTILSVTVTLTGGAGTSQPFTANLQ